jgi:hypothetical protein
MELIVMIALFSVCAISAFRPPWVFALIILLFPLKQVIQALCPTFITQLGAESVNYIVAITALAASAYTIIYKKEGLANWMNLAMIATIVLYVWSVITIIWSPGGKDGLGLVLGQLPYFFVIIIISPLLIRDINDLKASLQVLLWIGIFLALAFIFSPEFTSVDGRIALNLGGYRSNTLAIGELGGLLILIGATLRKGVIPGIGIFIRMLAIVLGAVVAIKAGSRGQFFVGVLVSIIFIPISAPVRNLFNFVAAIFVIAFVLISASFLLSTQLEGFAAKRFSTEEILGGASSADSRLSNLYLLFAAYAANPLSIFIGLGCNAFSALPGAAGQPYSHILFADAVCELGIPGTIFMGLGFWLGYRSTYQLLKFYNWDLTKRCVLATMGALIVAQTLLVNKQGSLWGTPILFPLLIVMARVWLNEQDSEPNVVEDTELVSSETTRS